MKNSNMQFLLALLMIAIVLLTLGYFFQSYLVTGSYTIPPNTIISAMIALIFVTVLIIFLLTRKLFVMVKQEKVIEVQKFYIAQLQEMINVVRAQRHDFVNHLQVVYTLLKTDQESKAQGYISELYQDIQISGEILQIEIPELTALLLAKMGAAASRNISMNIEIESDLATFTIKPIELTSIVANLVDNAFEAVESLTSNNRTVKLRILQTPLNFVLEVLNPGYISPEIQGKIFKTGFSTKTDKTKHGIGLTSIKHLVEKNRGVIAVNSTYSEGTKFTNRRHQGLVIA